MVKMVLNQNFAVKKSSALRFPGLTFMDILILFSTKSEVCGISLSDQVLKTLYIKQFIFIEDNLKIKNIISTATERRYLCNYYELGGIFSNLLLFLIFLSLT